jgi:hypothetical protein
MKSTAAILKHRGTEDTEFLFLDSLCALRDSVFPNLLSPKLLKEDLSIDLVQTTTEKVM